MFSLSNLKLTTQRHLINWPKGYIIPDDAIVQITQPTLMVDGQPVNNSAVDYSTVRTNLSIDTPKHPNQFTLIATYLNQTTAINLTADLVEPDQADWKPDVNAQSQTNPLKKKGPLMSKHQKTYQNQPKPKSKHRFLKLLIVLVMIILGITACHAHQQQAKQSQADQARQEQQAYQNGQRDQENKDLKAQVKDLQNAVAQYKKDQNEPNLDQTLDKIANQSNYDTVKQAADQIKNNPQEAQDALNRLNDSVNGLQHVINQLTNWLAANGYSF